MLIGPISLSLFLLSYISLVSLPIILKKTKVGQILQDSCISLLFVPILLYWIQVSVSFNVLLYFGAEMATFCIKHI